MEATGIQYSTIMDSWTVTVTVHKIIEMDFRHECNYEYIYCQKSHHRCHGELEPFICRLPDEGLSFAVSDVIHDAIICLFQYWWREVQIT
jgi:hypothetical protein